jgi:hypothetical protein
LKKIAWLLLVITPLWAKPTGLKPGQRYDFLASDGQHVYDAEFVRETKTAYLVRARGFDGELISVEKNILTEPPRPVVTGTPRPKKKVPGRWMVALAGDVRLATGSFAGYSRLFPGFSLFLNRNVPQMPYLGFGFVELMLQYSPIVKSPRRIDMFTLTFGPRWRLPFKNLKPVFLFIILAPAVSLFSFQSFSYDAVSVNAGGIAMFGADYAVKKPWFLTVRLATHYVYDTQSLVLMHAFSLGFGYSW